MKITLQKPLILASSSMTRRTLLEQAGIIPEIHAIDLDEDALRKCEIAKGTDIKEIALKLAEAKALKAADLLPANKIILAADQILELEGKIFSKPDTMEQGASHLKAMSGKTHFLHTAMVLFSEGKIIWRHISTPELKMRELSDAFIDAYLQAEGVHVLQSVGVYRIESLGIHLFSHIKGERSSILGLSMIPLLEALRHFGVLPDKLC